MDVVMVVGVISVLVVVSHEFKAGMLHTDLLLFPQYESDQATPSLIFKTQFSVLLPSGSPLCQLMYVGSDPSCQVKVPSTAWSFSPIQCGRPDMRSLTKLSSTELLMVANWAPFEQHAVIASV